MINRVKSLVRRMRRDQRGATFIFVAISFLAMVGFSAVVVDFGYAYRAKRVLQASADSAALAGAINLASGTGQAVSAANSYSSALGSKNALATMNVTATPRTVNCTGNTGATCSTSTSSPNGIMVTETATVPTFFGRALGFDSVPVSATSYALANGGKAPNTDVMIILDTTQSMGQTDTDSTDPACTNQTREYCALQGVQTLISGFTPPTQQVGLMIFPGLNTAAEAAQEYSCPNPVVQSDLAPYNASSNPPATQPPYYLIVGLSNDYKNGSSLNPNSNLVKAAGAAAGCTGIVAYGGEGTYYANVITAAQNYLASNGRPGANKMIILLSDGDANSNASPPAGQSSNECHEGIAAAQAAQSAGMTMVTIAYGSPTSGSCNTDTGSSAISACQTMTDMATVGMGSAAAPQWFYADGEGTSSCSSANSVSDLNDIFGSIGAQITNGGARLIPAS